MDKLQFLVLITFRDADISNMDITENTNAVPILSVFPALIVHSELKSVHPGFPVGFIF